MLLVVTTLSMVAAAIVIAAHSGNVLLILAAICGAAGVATLVQRPAPSPRPVTARLSTLAPRAQRRRPVA